MLMKDFLKELEEYYENFSLEAKDFYNQLKEKTEENLTEKGKKILLTMAENQVRYSNSFNAKQLGEFLFMSPRSVSGAMRKLISEGYVVKQKSSPITYSITEAGINIIDKK